ncbi:MAG: MBL fold metallo-hydrolase [Candidatus Micrarchaeota archaeon]|nr:MBL fold metallo-hydrolase [Candidatus Micrarchaeota archaeon]
MHLKFLGGCREVGRNAVLVNNRLLLDFGMKVETVEVPPRPKGIKSVVLTHPHLDHSGAVPMLNATVYSTPATLAQTRLLLEDAVKVQKNRNAPQYYGEREIRKMKEYRVTFGQELEVEGFTIDIYDSGHVPGSFGVLVNKEMFYTSDFRLSSTRLLNGASFDVKGIKTLIMESTYAFKEHPPREEVEKELVRIVNETVDSDGIALIPCFAIGRSMEILMVLDHYGVKCPIYLDGMAKTALDITLRYPEFLRDPKALEKAAERTIPLYDFRDRKMALKRPCVIVTTSGMLSGGPIISYLKKLHKKENCSLIFTGFQVPGTPGRTLLDTGYYRNGTEFKVNMRIEYLDFSAHADRNELLEFVKKIEPEKIILIHGDNCEEFASELSSMGFDATAPENGDSLEV